MVKVNVIGKACGWMLLAGLCFWGPTLFAADLYFSINDDANKYWDHAPGWKANGGAAGGVLPTADDTTTFNSTYLDIAHGQTPMQITNGIDAVCKTFWIASSGKGSGSSYLDDGRIIGVKMTGGTLSTQLRQGSKSDADDIWREFVVGYNSAGYGSFEMTGGELRPYRAVVGFEGIGVFTNNGGRIVMQDIPPTSCFAIGLKKGAQGTFTMLDGMMTTGVATNEGCFVSIGGSGTGTLNMEGGVISNIIVSLGTGVGHGTLNLNGGDIYKYLRIGAGSTATGVVNMTGGTIHHNVSAGYSSCGILNLTNGTITGDIYVGNQATSTGQVFMTGGKIGGVLYVGQNGKGFLDYDGGELSAGNLRIGNNAGSEGRVDVRRPLYQNNVYAGLDGDGALNVQTNMTINYLKIGSSTKAFGRVNVSSNSTLGIQTQICAGGSTLPYGVKGDQHDVGGCGEVVLNGGTIQFTTSGANTPNLFLGRYAAKFPGTFGVLRGYGRVDPSSEGATNVRMGFGDGQVIADGGTLDLNSVVNVTNLVANMPVDTSNGWYAVNGGYVRFPRTWYGSGTKFTRSIGATPYSPQPDFVNSMTFTVEQAPQGNNYFRGGVLAIDNENAHADSLPPNDGVAGLWTFGIFDSLLWSGKRAFTSISMTFHYDRTKVPEGRRVSLRRYVNGSWVRVGSACPAANEQPFVSTSKPLAPVSDAMNVGTFAVLADKVGMVIIFR